jgi:REP element-mobilizing transposase RayT
VTGVTRHSAIGLYAHITWHTWRRQQVIAEPGVPIIKLAAQSAAKRTRVRIHAIELLSDHLHVVVSYAPDTTVSAFIREAKSESARRVNKLAKAGRLRWCRGYYVNSLSRSHVRAARVYVARQRTHHPDRLPPRVG